MKDASARFFNSMFRMHSHNGPEILLSRNIKLLSSSICGPLLRSRVSRQTFFQRLLTKWHHSLVSFVKKADSAIRRIKQSKTIVTDKTYVKLLLLKQR